MIPGSRAAKYVLCAYIVAAMVYLPYEAVIRPLVLRKGLSGVNANAIEKEDLEDRVWGAKSTGDNGEMRDGQYVFEQRARGFPGTEWNQDAVTWFLEGYEGPAVQASQPRLAEYANALGFGRHHTQFGSKDDIDIKVTISAKELAGLVLSDEEPLRKRDDGEIRGSASTEAEVHGMDMSEDLVMSRLFGSAYHPTKVISYYLRATMPDAPFFSTQDITLCTVLTANRLSVFAALVEQYKGPVSATVHISNLEENEDFLKQLKRMHERSRTMREFVDIHVVYDSFERQFNMWRNVAKFFARTDFVMMLDVDFWICTDFRHRILSSPDTLRLLNSGTAALVVPAFEFNDQQDGMDPSTFPTRKPDLLNLVHTDKIDMFHKAWIPGHGATNYSRYYATPPGQMYRVTSYMYSYEPYVIYKKIGSTYCDERFIGYGGNKAACLFQLYVSGVSFYVLPDDFLIHRSHAYAEEARKHERNANRVLYSDYREETCLRYLYYFIDDLGSRRARNMLTECSKIPGFRDMSRRLAAGW